MTTTTEITAETLEAEIRALVEQAKRVGRIEAAEDIEAYAQERGRAGAGHAIVSTARATALIARKGRSDTQAVENRCPYVCTDPDLRHARDDGWRCGLTVHGPTGHYLYSGDGERVLRGPMSTWVVKPSDSSTAGPWPGGEEYAAHHRPEWGNY